LRSNAGYRGPKAVHLSPLRDPVAVPVAATGLPGKRTSLFTRTLLRCLVGIFDGKARLRGLLPRRGIPVRVTSGADQGSRRTADDLPILALVERPSRPPLVGVVIKGPLLPACLEGIVLRAGVIGPFGVFVGRI
jgi:hypothetical protein